MRRLGVAAVAVYASWAYDVTDDRLLVGAAANVFIGEVLAAEGGSPSGATDGDEGYPTTIYSVQPLQQIKGSLPSTVTVTQFGGYAPDGSLRFFENDGLLAAGMTYLFVTRDCIPMARGMRRSVMTGGPEPISLGEVTSTTA